MTTTTVLEFSFTPESFAYLSEYRASEEGLPPYTDAQIKAGCLKAREQLAQSGRSPEIQAAFELVLELCEEHIALEADDQA